MEPLCSIPLPTLGTLAPFNFSLVGGRGVTSHYGSSALSLVANEEFWGAY